MAAVDPGFVCLRLKNAPEALDYFFRSCWTGSIKTTGFTGPVLTKILSKFPVPGRRELPCSTASATASHAPLTRPPCLNFLSGRLASVSGRGVCWVGQGGRCELSRKQANLGAHAPWIGLRHSYPCKCDLPSELTKAKVTSESERGSRVAWLTWHSPLAHL
eukprot:1160006-Pelagomonas_calceolata.AAC.3